LEVRPLRIVKLPHLSWNPGGIGQFGWSQLHNKANLQDVSFN
jgi:hypothetical protein